jgi:hypothetical protein
VSVIGTLELDLDEDKFEKVDPNPLFFYIVIYSHFNF